MILLKLVGDQNNRSLNHDIARFQISCTSTLTATMCTELLQMIEETVDIPLKVQSSAKDSSLQNIEELKDTVKCTAIPGALDELREECEGQVLLVGSLPLTDIEHEERRIETQRIQQLQCIPILVMTASSS